MKAVYTPEEIKVIRPAGWEFEIARYELLNTIKSLCAKKAEARGGKRRMVSIGEIVNDIIPKLTIYPAGDEVPAIPRDKLCEYIQKHVDGLGEDVKVAYGDGEGPDGIFVRA